MMRSKPRKRRSLDKARRDSGHLTVWIDSRARTLQERRDVRRYFRRRRARWNLGFSSFPLSVVPLPDEAAPVLYCYALRFTSNAKSNFLVVTNGSRKNIQPADSSRNKDTLSTRDHCICLFTRETKSYPGI